MVKKATEQTRETKHRLRGFARAMRRKPTEAERTFWHVVRGRQFENYKFRRQVPVSPYIADFLCVEHRVIVEFDGGKHEETFEYDFARDEALRTFGYRVVRFENWQLAADIGSVLEVIKAALDASAPSPRPSPPLRGGEGE